MGFSLTDDQKKAVETREKNILVSAAAGSGKTAVLVRRIIAQIIDDKADIERMLVVTFTNAAANQMKEKIREALEKAQAEGADGRIIRNQLRKLSSANISTMHAFCIKLLRTYFHEMAIDPAFKILNTSSDRILREKALTQVLEDFYQAEEEDFIAFAQAYGGRKMEGLEDLIHKVISSISSQIDPLGFFKEAMEASGFEKRLVLEEAKRVSSLALELQELAIRDLREDDETKGYHGPVSEDGVNLSQLASLAESEDYDGFCQALASFVWPRLGTCPKADPAVLDRIKELRETYRAEIDGLKELIGGRDSAALVAEGEQAQAYLKVICRILEAYYQLLWDYKLEKRSLSFSDIEHLTVKLLEKSDLGQEIREGIDFIFFDEYQDINPLQEYIIELLAGENNLFFVGDIKQSIYKFRLAEPKIFIDRYKDYSQNSEEGQDEGPNKLVTLDQNFRSSPVILKYLNHIFKYTMNEKVGQIDYRAEGQALVGGKEELVDGSFLRIVINEEPTNLGYDDFEANPHFIAKEIAKLVEEGYDYKDMVILMRSLRNSVDAYERVLRAYNIPFFTDISNVNLENPEVGIFIDMLKLVNNSKEDLALLSVLTTPLGQMVEDDLARIRSLDQDGSFYQCLEKARDLQDGVDDQLRAKVQAFYQRLDYYRSQLVAMSLSDFGYFLAEDSGYISYLMASHLGEEKKENLMAFIDRMVEYQAFSADGLLGFLQEVERMLSSPSDSLEPRSLLSDQKNVVRIMTIHKSKGLEFPIVFLSDIQKGFYIPESRDKVSIDPDLGIGMEIIDLDKKIKYTTVAKSLINAKQKREAISEEIRLLYVATTRAEKGLYLVGHLRDLDDLEKMAQKDSRLSLLKANSFQDWILYVALRDKAFNHSLKLEADKELNSKTGYDKHYQFIDNDYEPMSAEAAGGFDIGRIAGPEEPVQGLFDRVFNYRYPNLEKTQLPYKETVSDLSSLNYSKSDDTFDFPSFYRDDIDWDLSKKPKALRGREYNSAEMGTLIHFVFSRISFKNHDLASIEDELDRMVVEELILEEEREKLDPRVFLQFFQSDLGKRAIAAGPSLSREKSFTMKYKDFYLDGQIDVFFEEDGQLILFDFKTDTRIKKNAYEQQLNLYKEALEKARGKKVGQMYIYWTKHASTTRVQ